MKEVSKLNTREYAQSEAGMGHNPESQGRLAGTHQGIELRDEERTRCEVWTRVMGYHRPVAAFNTGKQGEHAERRYFIEGRTRNGAPLRP